MVGLGKTPRHSTLQARQTFSQIQYVIVGDLALNRDRIIRLCADRTRFTNFVQYFIAFCSRPEAASYVKSSRFVRLPIYQIVLEIYD